MSVRISTAELPGADGLSEDRVFTTANAVVLLDGVGPVDLQGADRTGWYPNALGQAIVDLLTPQVDLRTVVSKAISQVAGEHDLGTGVSPAATVAILRWGAETVDGLVLGDSPIVVFTSTGADVLYDARHSAVVAELRSQAMRERGLSRPRNREEHRALVRATTPRKHAVTNTPAGYWIAAADPAAGSNALTRSWPATSTRAALVTSDGVSCGVVKYRAFESWAEALYFTEREGLPALLGSVHHVEATDPECTRWPRSKVHDDKAAALLVNEGFERG